MKELRTEILINSTAARIWNILMDFDKYPEWNPFILAISGKAHLRERLKVTIQSGNSKPMIFKPKITLLKKEKEFGWLGQLLITGIFDGHHIFEIKEIEDDQCLFIHKEQFSGLLVSLFWTGLDTKTRVGFVAMNEKLKELAEK